MQKDLNHLPEGTYYSTSSNYSGLSQTSRFRGYVTNTNEPMVSMFPIGEMIHEKPKQFKRN